MDDCTATRPYASDVGSSTQAPWKDGAAAPQNDNRGSYVAAPHSMRSSSRNIMAGCVRAPRNGVSPWTPASFTGARRKTTPTVTSICRAGCRSWSMTTSGAPRRSCARATDGPTYSVGSARRTVPPAGPARSDRRGTPGRRVHRHRVQRAEPPRAGRRRDPGERAGRDRRTRVRARPSGRGDRGALAPQRVRDVVVRAGGERLVSAQGPARRAPGAAAGRPWPAGARTRTQRWRPCRCLPCSGSPWPHTARPAPLAPDADGRAGNAGGAEGYRMGHQDGSLQGPLLPRDGGHAAAAVGRSHSGWEAALDIRAEMCPRSPVTALAEALRRVNPGHRRRLRGLLWTS